MADVANRHPAATRRQVACHKLHLHSPQRSKKNVMAKKSVQPLEFGKLSSFGSKDLAKNVKKESLKVQKNNYRMEKKRATNELLSTLQDPTIVVLSDWLKVRGSLKSWTKLWCVLKPGLLVLYKSHKGPRGESIGALTLPLPTSYLIFRAPSEAAGVIMSVNPAYRADSFSSTTMPGCSGDLDEDMKTDKDDDKTDSDDDDDDDDDKMNKRGNDNDDYEEGGRDSRGSRVVVADVPPVESPYVENVEEELGQLGDASQTEEVADENKSIIWSLVKQVRPGMDLSRVALPTFILEPRSFLDKLSDYYYHADLLSEAVNIEDPYSRMKMVVKWYLSGFYKKPKGLKKPYNPILGETFRCFWKHPKTGSRTFYIAEQDGFTISGSILAKSKFYGNSLSAILDGVCRLVLLNRGEDYTITMPYAHCKGILIGTLTMEFGGEVSIQCEKTGYKADIEFKLKPFLGLVGGEASNRIVGKIKLGDETLSSIDGHWDNEITIKDKKTGTTELFWKPTQEVRCNRLKRYTILLEAQSDFESERLWSHVSDAILRGDQQTATDEKCILEEEQRKSARERKAKLVEWVPNLFERNVITGEWIYKYAELVAIDWNFTIDTSLKNSWRPWDPLNDVIQFERDFIISTKTHHQTPIVHTTSITSMEEKPTVGNPHHGHSRHPSMDCANRMKRIKMRSMCPNNPTADRSVVVVGSANEEATRRNRSVEDDGDSESSLSAVEASANERQVGIVSPTFGDSVHSLIQVQKDTTEKLASVQLQLTAMQSQLRSLAVNSSPATYSVHDNVNRHASFGRFDQRDFIVFLFAVFIQGFFVWFFK
ncbi:hypothetical protein HELRODRAFT_168751 [Helobdella robusta]|uniref:PH domain-containing protein n=1 Tax=Helobdella robusta TaxID=6412 RepID=T1F0X4_HELRO|nr:hypothetical protein HELRODRAFT_168751 [Helobdella robusta]ESO08840.1 hypothetical protein HELRODRAFT_168751 [Helobdella robusta]